MNELAVSNLVGQIKHLSEKVNAEQLVENLQTKSSESFTDVMKGILNQVNDQQIKASEMGVEYQLGNKEIDTAKLMIEIQKARISFEALNQFRNHAISAYKDIMNMQI